MKTLTALIGIMATATAFAGGNKSEPRAEKLIERFSHVAAK